MAESDSPLPATLWSIPAPLILVATVALFTFFGLQRTSNESGTGKAVPQSAGVAARASDAAAPSRPPAMELLRRYLNEVHGEDSSKASEFAFSSRLSLPDSSGAELTVGFSSPAHTPAAGAQAGETGEEKRFRELKDELKNLCDEHPFKMQCLVATVPDPIDSHLQLMFDAALAAMTRACEQHEYVLDRYELPWSKELRERPVTGRPDVRKYRHPGAVLFRKLREPAEFDKGETCDLLMLLLVGETPTGGVRKSSLCAALDFVAAWDQAAQASHRLSVQLLGPCFSGSSPSLRWSVFDWKKNRHLSCHTDLEVYIVSGSATAKSNREILTARTDPAGRGENGWPPLKMEFHSTIIPDRAVKPLLMDHLVNTRGIGRDRIALLMEGNTGYGHDLTSSDKTGKQGNADTAREEGFEGVLVLPFPMALSRIRSEYEQSQAERAEFAGELPRGTRRNLKLPLAPPPYATDALPTFAEGASAVTDLSLEQILGTISRRGIRAVGIFGTDIRDKLFLAQQVRRHAPNVQLFMLESDLLYTHADYAPSLSGTLIASTYPLFTQNQHWTGSDPKELLFPADTAEGVYNAAILLLNRLHPSKPRPLLDYSYPFAKQAGLRGSPPLWLTMAGESRLWPVQAIRLDQSDDSEALARIDGNTQTGEPEFRLDPPSSIPAVVATLLSLAFVAVFWAVNWGPSAGAEPSASLAAPISKSLARLRASCRWLALPDSEPLGTTPAAAAGEEPAARDTATPLHLLCFSLALLAQQALLSSPIIVFIHAAFAHSEVSEIWPELVVSFVSLAVAAVLVWVVLGLAFRLLLAVRAGGPHSYVKAWRLFTRNTWILLATGVGIAGWYLLQSSYSMPDLARTQAAIFVERMGTLNSGVTWLVPAVLLAAILASWAACQLWRLHFSKIYPLGNPLSPKRDALSDVRGTGEPEDIHTAGFSSRIRDLDGRLKSAWFVPTELVDWLFLVLLAFGLIYVLGLRWIGTAEGWTFDFTFRWAAGLAIMLIGWSLIHVKSVGGLFERLLRRMAQHAMVSAYDRIPDRLAAKAAGQIFAASPHAGDFEQPVRCLTQLAEEAPGLWLDAKQESRRAQDQFAELLDCSRSQKEDADRRAAELNCLLADIAARQLAPRLIQYWNRKAVVRGRDQETEDKKDASTASMKWETQAEVFLAMQFVTLIRQVFAHIKNQLTFLVLMLLCLLAAFHAYPFQPGRLIMQLCYGLTFWCLFTTVLLIIRFNRCEVLSRLSNTTPNRFTFDRTLVLPMLTFVVIPLISLLAVQFPGIGRMLFGWLEACRNSLPA